MRKYILSALLMLVAVPAFAQGNESGSYGIALAIGLIMSIAPLGGAIGQAIAAQSALGGIARNPAAQPKLFVPMIIALALIESLVIYALVIAFQLVGKL
tara:strand:- start:410 stop:706 length:297 start_codon:yes stop_codon:yes gene_type:complete